MATRARHLVVGCAVAVLLVGGLGLTVAIPSSVDQQTDSPDSGLEPAFTDAYEVESSVTLSEAGVDEPYQLEGGFGVADGAVRERAHHDTVEDRRIVDRYVDLERDWETARLATDDADLLAAWVDAQPESDVVDRFEEDGDHVLLVASETTADADERAEAFYGESTLDTVLAYPAYERTAETTVAGRDAVRYEPRDGWYEVLDGTQPFREYRVSDAEGELVVDAETGTLLAADLSFRVVGAGSYAGYVVERASSGDVLSVDVEYSFDDGGTVERPDWATDPD